MLTVAIPKRNKLQNIIVLTPKDGSIQTSVWGSAGCVWRTVFQFNGRKKARQRQNMTNFIEN